MPCRLTDYYQCTTLVSEAGTGGSHAWWGGREYTEISLPSSQFCREPKTTLKKKVRRGKVESTSSRPAVATAGLQETDFLDLVVEEGMIRGGVGLARTLHLRNVIACRKAVFGRLVPRRKDVWFSKATDVPKYRG